MSGGEFLIWLVMDEAKKSKEKREREEKSPQGS